MSATRLQVLGAITLGTAALLSTAVPDAHAATFAPSGRPGSVSIQQTLGNANWTYSTVRLWTGSTTAGRSPATTGTQHITIRTRIWQMLSGQWQLISNNSVTRVVGAGQQAVSPNWYLDSIGGYFSTDVLVTWRTSTGTVLGSAFRDYVHAGDYACTTGPICWIAFIGGQYSISLS